MIRSLLAGSLFAAVATVPASSASVIEYRIPAFAPKSQTPLILAQSGDSGYRINELEQEVRRLNGKVEELTFQLLQMQEQLRKMQENNELRFQELEDKRSDASGSIEQTDPSNVATVRKNDLDKPQKLEQAVSTAKPKLQTTSSLSAPQKPVTAPGPRVLGTLTFDANGNVVNSQNSDQQTGSKIAAVPLPGVFSDGVDNNREAAEYGPTPDAVLEVAKTALANKRYRRAEGAVRAAIKAWPNHSREGEARYYLAESLFWQKDYYKAANIYLDTHNAHPQASTAADNLLGLGLSLAGLNQREVACATYAEVLKQYPQANARLSTRLEAEQASAKC